MFANNDPHIFSSLFVTLLTRLSLSKANASYDVTVTYCTSARVISLLTDEFKKRPQKAMNQKYRVIEKDGRDLKPL
jgi:hypothetical protein